MVPARIPVSKNADAEVTMQDDDEDDEDEYRVEKILKHGHAKGGAVIYQVKWLGYDNEEDLTWEPSENLFVQHTSSPFESRADKSWVATMRKTSSPSTMIV